VKTSVSIGTLEESADSAHGCDCGEPASEAGCGCQGGGCVCQQSAPAQSVDDVGLPADISTPRTLRTSSYIIYVDLPHNDSEMLLVHGYSGAFDKVSKRVATFVRAKEDRRAPKPLYGEWTDTRVVDSAPELPDAYIEVLLKRGYLTYLTREEELERFKAIADYLHTRTSVPTYVLMPTYDCNLRCFYCFQDHMRTNPDFAHLLQRMSHGMVDRIFDTMPQIEALHGISPETEFSRPITLFGGEPLLRSNRDIIEHILDRAHKGGTPSLSVISNATDLDAYKDLLGPNDLSSIQITLDGVPEEHDRRRIYPDGRGSFDAIARNITMALEQDANIQVRMNIDRNNVSQLPRLARIFVDQGWSVHPRFFAYTAPIHAGNGKAQHENSFSSWELDQAIDELRAQDEVMEVIHRPDDRLRSRVQSIFDSGGHPGSQSTFCGAHNGMYVIDRFGDMYACWERTGNTKIRIGRITPECTVELNDSNSELWRTRTVTSNPVCRQCRYSLYCGGGCAVLAEGRTGRIDRNFCDGYGFRFRAMVAEAYTDYSAGKAVPVVAAELCDM
jgi:uncharacterized protein